MSDTSRTDTPRTDEEAFFPWERKIDLQDEFVDAYFARDLERELDAMREQRDRLAEACAGIEQAYLEGSDSEWGHAFMAVREALQSLTTNIPTSEKI